MGQKVRPTGFRVGIMTDWLSSWYANKQDFAELLVEDKKLAKDLEDLCHRHIEVKTMEVNRPEIDAQLVSQDIAEQLQKRASFRRTMKRAMDTTMENGAKGVRIQLSGRLGGAEMARTESNMSGSIPLSTLRARIDYGFTQAKTAQGHIGVKVWINNGDYLEPEPEPAPMPSGGQGGRGRDRRGRGPRREF